MTLTSKRHHSHVELKKQKEKCQRLILEVVKACAQADKVD